VCVYVCVCIYIYIYMWVCVSSKEKQLERIYPLSNLRLYQNGPLIVWIKCSLNLCVKLIIAFIVAQSESLISVCVSTSIAEHYCSLDCWIISKCLWISLWWLKSKMETSPTTQENCRMSFQPISLIEKIISTGLNSLRPSWKGKERLAI